VGQTVFVGGLARLDVLGCSGATLYLTIWASSDIPCHYGKVDCAEERCVLQLKLKKAELNTVMT